MKIETETVAAITIAISIAAIIISTNARSMVQMPMYIPKRPVATATPAPTPKETCTRDEKGQRYCIRIEVYGAGGGGSSEGVPK